MTPSGCGVGLFLLVSDRRIVGAIVAFLVSGIDVSSPVSLPSNISCFGLKNSLRDRTGFQPLGRTSSLHEACVLLLHI